MDEEPRLSREVLSVAWLVAKVLVAVAVPLLVLGLLLRNHPYLLMGAVYGLLFAGLIFFYGYQEYKRKKNALERERKWKAQDAEWHEQRRKRYEGETRS